MTASRSLVLVLLVVLATAASAQSDAAYSESEVYKPDLPAFVNKKDRPKKKDKDKDKSEEAASATPSLQASAQQVSFGVYDSTWNAVNDLKAEEVELFLNREKQEVSSIQRRTHPLDLVFLIDMSPSVTDRVKHIRAWIEEVVKTLSPDDRITVATFSSKHRIVVDSSTDRTALAKALGKLEIDSGTSLYDAIETTAKAATWTGSSKIVLLVSDGVDTTSTRSSFVPSLAAASAANIEFYPVYLDTLSDAKAASARVGRQLQNLPIPFPVRQSLLGTNEKEYEDGRRYLTHLLRFTGGLKFTFPSDAKDISPEAKKVASTISARYILTLPSKDPPAAMLASTEVRIRVKRPNLNIVTRSFVGSSVSVLSGQK